MNSGFRTKRFPAGGGLHDTVAQLSTTRTGSAQVQFQRADIRTATDWAIQRSEDTVIVHLAGRMISLETEVDGLGSSRGPAVPGEVWTVPAGVVYKSHAKGDVIDFAVLTTPAMPSDDQRPTRLALRAGHSDHALLNSLQRLRSTMELHDDASRLDVAATTCEIWEHVNAAYTDSTAVSPVSHRLDSANAILVRDYVFENLDTRITLDRLSSLVGQTTHQFLIAFRDSFGMSPGQYIIKERLRAAQRYLLHTSWDITTIALRCGFSSHSHLTSTFSRRLAMTPSRFRQRYR